VATFTSRLADRKPEARVASIRKLGDDLQRHGFALDAPAPRERILAGLRGALKDPDVAVRAAAAEMLGNLFQAARPAIGDLSLALNDQDQQVRVSAAAALIRASNDNQSRGPAIRSLAGALADPEPLPDRMALVNALRTAGEPGEEAAVKALMSLLSGKDEKVRLDALRCMPALGSLTGRIPQVLEPLLKAGDPGVRSSAAIATMQQSDPQQPPDPRVLAVVEAAVVDTSLSFELRSDALGALYGLRPGGLMATGMAGGMMSATLPPGSPGPPALRRCGLILARQLEHADLDVRVTAARLLQMIDPEILAGKGN
jgi:HEAT repeats